MFFAFLACLAYTMLYALCAMPSVITHCPYLIDQPAQTYVSCFRTNVSSFMNVAPGPKSVDCNGFLWPIRQENSYLGKRSGFKKPFARARFDF